MPAPVLVVETGVSHSLADGALNARRRECEQALEALRARWPILGALADLPLADVAEAESILEDPYRRRMRHIVTETARTREAAAALATGDMKRVGALLVEGQASLLNDYESSVDEAETIVKSAVAHGAWGARLTGAGWGGAVIALAPAGEEERIMSGIGADFATAFGRTPAMWQTKASAGVSTVD